MGSKLLQGLAKEANIWPGKLLLIELINLQLKANIFLLQLFAVNCLVILYQTQLISYILEFSNGNYACATFEQGFSPKVQPGRWLGVCE